MKQITLTKNDIVLFDDNSKKQRDLVAEFILNRYPNEHTAKAIVVDLRQFALFLQDKFNKTLFQIESYELGIYRKHMKDVGYKIGSINRKLASLKAFYRFLHEVNYLNDNRAAYLRLFKNSSKIGSTQAFEMTQLKQLFDSFDETKLNDLRDKVICGIAFFCAARVSAILNLSFDDILREESGIKIKLVEKGGKVRYLHCNSQLLAPTLLRYLNVIDFSEGFLFRGFRVNKGFTEKQFGRQNCHAMIKRRTKNLKFQQNLSMHSMRASFATAWLEKNYSIDSLQKIGGWANLDTVKRYDRNSQEASISEMEMLKI